MAFKNKGADIESSPAKMTASLLKKIVNVKRKGFVWTNSKRVLYPLEYYKCSITIEGANIPLTFEISFRDMFERFLPHFVLMKRKSLYCRIDIPVCSEQ